MRLKSISYKDDNWELENLELGLVNLIVGKNAVGKTRTLGAIDTLINIITTGKVEYAKRFDVGFLDKNELIQFRFKVSSYKEKSIFEEINVNNQRFLIREPLLPTKLYNSIEDDFDVINPPMNKLVLNTNRDVKKYPLLEKIANWAEKSYGFIFIDKEGLSGIFDKIENRTELFEVLEENYKIVAEMNEIGFPVTSINRLMTPYPYPNLLVKERGVSKGIIDYHLSQGMNRTLELLIKLEYVITKKQPTTIVIDDFCEGLDYDRATKLGKLVFKKCEENNIQLIATTNDSFLMDVVDIDYWNILYREGNIVKSINKVTHPEVFEDFQYTGLSNFYFFTSDFIPRNL